MTRVWVSAGSAIVKAGLEAIVRSDAALEIAPSGHECDVWLVDADSVEPTLGESPAVALSIGPAASLLRQGFSAVLGHDASAIEITSAVRAAAAGLVVMERPALDALFHSERPVAAGAVAIEAHLTPRETEILRLLAAGLANKEIAGRLNISEHTVKFHVAAVLQKLNAASRAEAVAIGMRSGLILL